MGLPQRRPQIGRVVLAKAHKERAGAGHAHAIAAFAEIMGEGRNKPNPTTGFFFYLPRKDVIELKMSVEDAAKIVMSAGLITPDEQQAKLAALASDARDDNAA